MLNTAEPFLTAETDYRLDRAKRLYGAGPRDRRHAVARRPSLRLPHWRRRPLSLA